MQVTNFAQPSPGVQTPVGTNMAVNGITKQLSNSVVPAADTLSITSNKIMIVQQVVTQQVEIALEIKSPVSYSSHAGDDDKDQVDKLVNKVVQKIHDEKSSSTEDLSDDDNHSAAVKSVRVKVAQGFESATLALTRSGMMDNSVANNVEQARSRVDAAIDLVASQPTAGTANETLPASVETAAVNMVGAKRELASSLQVTTRDGDVVTVNFSRSQAMAAGSAVGPEGSLVYASSASSLLVDIRVQGDLSEKESKAIREVVESINKLAEKLFSGKTGAAMEKLSELKINTEYLAGMSLSMSSSISYQAMSAYAQVSRLPDESAPVAQGSVSGGAIAPSVSSAVSNNTSNNETASAASVPAQVDTQGSTAAPVVSEAAEVVNEAVASDVFENPFNAIRDLFAQIADMFTFAQNDITDDHKDFVSELFKDIVDKVEDSNGDDDSDESVVVNDLAA